MPGELLFETTRAQMARFEAEDGPEAQALFERCADFFELIYGHPPEPAEAQSMFVSLPEGRGYDDKFTAGIYRERSLVGVLDAIRNHPAPDEWAVGLLLLEPSHRGDGLGREVYEGFEHWAAALGARVVRLVVQERNPRGRAFWERLGFAHERTENRRQGVRDNICHILARRIAIEGIA